VLSNTGRGAGRDADQGGGICLDTKKSQIRSKLVLTNLL
jgi:hypothetical protein